MKVLAIDTAGSVASAALMLDGAAGPVRSADEPRAHANHVLSLVDDVLREADIALADIDRFAFGRGPGGLTGLRVAASVVQGFAFVFERPVVAVSNLTAMALACLADDPRNGDADGIFAAHDAGMGQVAWGFFTYQAMLPQPLGDEVLSRPDDVPWRPGRWLGVGSACASFATQVASGVILEWRTAPAVLAPQLAALGAQEDARLRSAEAAQPVYLRHPVSGRDV